MKIFFSLIFSALLLFACKEKTYYVEVSTEFGNMVIKLHNETPLHRDNFLVLTKAGYFDDLLFHRVIDGFVIQGGDPDSKNAMANVLLGEGGPNYTVQAEFDDSLYHQKGAVGAARDDNPQKASSASQFYIVQGKTYKKEALHEAKRDENPTYSPQQIKVYKTRGGTPFLDNRYTVFGQLVEGVEVLDEIAALNTDSNDRPVVDIPMKIRLIKWVPEK